MNVTGFDDVTLPQGKPMLSRLLSRTRQLGLITLSLITALVTNSLIANTSFASDQLTICMIPYSSDSKRAQVTVRNAQEYVRSQDASLVVYNEVFNSLDDQYRTFKKTINDDCDAVIIEPRAHSPVAAEFATAVNTAIKGGTPVVAILSNIDGAQFTSHIVIDGRSIGDHLALATCSRVNPGDKVFHVFPKYSQKQDQEIENAALDEFTMQTEHLCPDVTFVRIEAELPRDVQRAVTETLDVEGVPALVVTDHPKATTQTLRALERQFRGHTENIKMVGFGASSSIFKAMHLGKIDAAVVADYKHFTEQAIIAAVLATSEQKVNLGRIVIPLHEMTTENSDRYKEFYSID